VFRAVFSNCSFTVLIGSASSLHLSTIYADARYRAAVSGERF
jgi:hypothetical protein